MHSILGCGIQIGMKTILSIILLFVWNSAFAESLYDQVRKQDASKKSKDVFEQEYDASKIKRESRMQKANKKLLADKTNVEEAVAASVSKHSVQNVAAEHGQSTGGNEPSRVTNRDVAAVIRGGAGATAPTVRSEGGVSARERVMQARTAGSGPTSMPQMRGGYNPASTR